MDWYDVVALAECSICLNFKVCKPVNTADKDLSKKKPNFWKNKSLK